MFSGIARLRCLASWARAGLAATVGAVAVLGVCAGAPLPADAGESATPAGLACPSPNLPNMLTLVAGTPQTAPLEAAFATGLPIALSNSDGCPVTGAAG